MINGDKNNNGFLLVLVLMVVGCASVLIGGVAGIVVFISVSVLIAAALKYNMDMKKRRESERELLDRLVESYGNLFDRYLRLDKKLDDVMELLFQRKPEGLKTEEPEYRALEEYDLGPAIALANYAKNKKRMK